MFDRTVFFRLVAWAGTECDLRRKSREWVHADRPPGQKRKAFRSGHPLSERDRAKKDYGKVDLEIFENACRYFLENISEFKDLLSEKVPTLKKADWLYSKGRTKTCKADDTGKKKKCKVGLEYTPNLYFRIYLCKI